ncbi:hypothetical protein [Brevundimonas nasdae]|uniref:Peptidase M1 membrane alanine aminopeptidase domain-containing protein n=1 Tax=Brevundimonas nasdae TaxID=172043 RepID=A0ABX8TIB3_9CAUL|nr:hypothetical protein [Brevundimonas nasdae]QYC08864.1 hypothetical protein KWG56_09405 [Brevundimonas nasdae]QYC14913.1 hypothetical protein KWG63_04740 [Brevundimonas nasdae]
MRLTLIAAVTLCSSTALLAACAATSSVSSMAVPQVQARSAPSVTVTRNGDILTADYVFTRDAPVWAFTESALMTGSRQPWRPTQWTVETPGVVMERHGAYDTIRSRDGGLVPRHVRFIIRPRSVDLEAAYRTITFSDGAVALPTRQFDVFAVRSVAEAAATPDDLNGVDVDGGPSPVTWRDASGPVLYKGERRANLTTTTDQSYVLMGQATVTRGDGLTTVMDPSLPSWIGEEIRSFAPRVGDYYKHRLGPSGDGDEIPVVMVGWNGPTERMTSMAGSALSSLIVMRFEGAGVVQPSKQVQERSRWFIGHESAHFWLGQAVRYETARDMWITEGGADLMAVRALQQFDPGFDVRAELQNEVKDCAELTVNRGVADAGQRGEHRAYYACGAVFAMAAEGAQKKRTGGDWFDFLRGLIDANRADGVLTREEWLSALTRASGDPTLRLDIERLLDQGAANPSAVIARLFERTGVAFRMVDGQVVLT